MSYKRTIELVNPLTDERKFVDVEIERNCSQLLSEEADRQKPDDDWCLVGVHPHGHIDPMELRARIERMEHDLIVLGSEYRRLAAKSRQQSGLILKLDMDFHRRRFVTLRRVRTGE